MKLTKLVLLTAFFLMSSASLFAQGKIVYIDSQKILENYTAFKDAQKQVEDLKATYEKEFQDMQARGQKMVDELESQSLLLSPEKKADKENQIRELQAQLEQFYYQKLGPQGELFQENQKLTQPIIDQITKLIQSVGERDGYDLILDKAQGLVLYGKTDMDITQKVLDELDKTQ